MKMWDLLKKRKYDGSAKNVNLFSNRLNPESDFTIDKLVMPAVQPEQTWKKDFCSEEKRNNELAFKGHNNLFGKRIDENYKLQEVCFSGKTTKGIPFTVMPYLGEQNDYDKVKFADKKTQAEYISKDISTLATLMACEQKNQYKSREYRKNGDYKLHNSITKFSEAMGELGVDLDMGVLRKAANYSKPLMGREVNLDSWLGNFIEGTKIDEDKSGPNDNFCNAAHLIETLAGFTKDEREEFKDEFLRKYNERIDKMNNIVYACQDNPKGTMLWLIEEFLPADMPLVQKIKKKIERKDPKTLDQHFSMLNTGKLKGNIYAIQDFVENMVERDYMTKEEFDVRYNTGKLWRAMGTFKYFHSMSKKAEEDSLDKIHYEISKQDQLEKAIEAADWIVNSESVAKYDKSGKIRNQISKVKDMLDSAYDKLYKQPVEEITEEPAWMPYAIPAMPLEYAIRQAA